MLSFAILSAPDASGKQTVLNVFAYEAADDAPEGARDVSALAPRPEQDWAFDGATFTPPSAPVLDPVELAALKSGLSRLVDADAEALRLRLITPGSGQAMEYQEAYAEAVQVDQASKAGQALDAAAFPMLAASIGFDRDPQTGKPTVDVVGEARAVLAAYDAYQRAGAAIRGARLAAKKAIDEAATGDAARAAFAATVWPPLV